MRHLTQIHPIVQILIPNFCRSPWRRVYLAKISKRLDARFRECGVRGDAILISAQMMGEFGFEVD